MGVIMPLIQSVRTYRFWQRHRPKGVRDRRKAHTLLTGLCAKTLNRAVDWAISQNKWPYMFPTASGSVDLTPAWIICVWTYYVANMVLASPTCAPKTPTCATKHPHTFLTY